MSINVNQSITDLHYQLRNGDTREFTESYKAGLASPDVGANSWGCGGLHEKILNELPRFVCVAAETDNISAIKFLANELFKFGYSTSFVNFNRETGGLPVHLAAEKGDNEMLVLLADPVLYFVDEAISGTLPFQISQLVREYCSDAMHSPLAGLGLSIVEDSATLSGPVNTRMISFCPANKEIDHLAGGINVNFRDLSYVINRIVMQNTLAERKIDYYIDSWSTDSQKQESLWIDLSESFQLLKGKTPLHLAAQHDNPSTVRKLLKMGAISVYAEDPDDGLMLPLHFAIRAGSVESVKALLTEIPISDSEAILKKASQLVQKYKRKDIQALLGSPPPSVDTSASAGFQPDVEEKKSDD